MAPFLQFKPGIFIFFSSHTHCVIKLIIFSNIPTSTQGAAGKQNGNTIKQLCFLQLQRCSRGCCRLTDSSGSNLPWGVSFSPQPAWLLSRHTSFLPVRACSGWWWWLVCPVAGWLAGWADGWFQSKFWEFMQLACVRRKKTHNQTPRRVWIHKHAGKFWQFSERTTPCKAVRLRPLVVYLWFIFWN